MKSIMVTLECLTNLHAGNGDVNYNIVDNEVERDPVTNYPTINASGVKGALRVFLKGNARVEEWFGSEGDTKQGKLKVLAASMLAMPARATNGSEAFYMLSTPTIKAEYEKNCACFNLPCKLDTEKEGNGKEAEGIALSDYFSYTGKKIYVVKDDAFRKIDLPVIARNKLEDGKSKNLWYEEVVPHNSIMYFAVLADDSDESLLKEFRRAVEGKVIQFGGNASIGYGLCKVSVEGVQA